MKDDTVMDLEKTVKNRPERSKDYYVLWKVYKISPG
jgi:hypothetical protein